MFYYAFIYILGPFKYYPFSLLILYSGDFKLQYIMRLHILANASTITCTDTLDMCLWKLCVRLLTLINFCRHIH